MTAAKEKIPLRAGERFGRWTVLDGHMAAARGETKYLCRCDCGTERYVLERSLRSGGSVSCGCQRREAAKQSAYDLRGRVFGELTALHRAENQSKNGGVWWTCRCSCGSEIDFPATLLTTGKRTSCGCRNAKSYAQADIRGQRFGRLTALEPTAQRDSRGSVIWRCRCDCGSEVEVAHNRLMYANMRSCGCQKREHDQKLKSFLTHVDGTSVDMLMSKKLPTNNTTGYKGVYLVRGSYMAKIVFQKKQYVLGSFAKIEDAAEARKAAEEVLFDGVAEHYRKWRQYAELDPEWGRDNPIRIRAYKNERAQMCISLEPDLEGPVMKGAVQRMAAMDVTPAG